MHSTEDERSKSSENESESERERERPSLAKNFGSERDRDRLTGKIAEGKSCVVGARVAERVAVLVFFLGFADLDERENF